MFDTHPAYLRELYTYTQYAISDKGNKFCDSLLAFLYNDHHLKRCPL